MTLRTVGVSVREHLGRVDRDALVHALLGEPGIGDVFFRSDEPHRLYVAYDPAVLSDSSLLTRLYRHGVHPEPVGPQASPRAPFAAMALPPQSATPRDGQASLWTAP